jgi:hypothetical protein
MHIETKVLKGSLKSLENWGIVFDESVGSFVV